MNQVTAQELQAAVAEAAQAYLKVMALRGFTVRDYPQNFVAQMAQQSRHLFAPSQAGAHPQADQIIPQVLQAAQPATQPARAQRMRGGKTLPFTLLRGGIA